MYSDLFKYILLLLPPWQVQDFYKSMATFAGGALEKMGDQPL
jgi:hypothetical protein